LEVELKDKGRVTIPSGIRKALALEKGDRLSVEVGEGVIKLKPKRVVSAEEIKGIAKIKRVRLEDVEVSLAGE